MVLLAAAQLVALHVAAQMAPLSELAADQLSLMEPGGASYCADGTPFSFLVRKGTTNADKVLVDFMGGGACWGDRCFEDASISFQSISNGIMGFAAALAGQTTEAVRALLTAFGTGAPVALDTAVGDVSTWTYVLVPYCTQDIHLGSCDVAYTHSTTGQRRTVRHNGAANVRSVMDWVDAQFGTGSPPDTLAFVGCSAGASAVVFTEAARARQRYGSATTVVAVGDSPSNLLTEQFVRRGLVRWGADAALAQATGLNITENLHERLVQEALSAILTAHPTTQLAVYTRREDTTQLFQYQLMGGMVDDLEDSAAMTVWMRQNLAMLEGLASDHDNFKLFVADGEGHCSLSFSSAIEETCVPTLSGSCCLVSPSLLTLTRGFVEYRGFAAWLETLLEGGAPASQTCGAQCTLGGVAGCDGAVGSGALEDRCGECGGDGSSCAVISTPGLSCPPLPPVVQMQTSGARRQLAAPGLLLVGAVLLAANSIL